MNDEPLTFEELMQKRRDLEVEIGKLLKKFYEETEIPINKIYLESNSAQVGPTWETWFDVKAEIII